MYNYPLPLTLKVVLVLGKATFTVLETGQLRTIKQCFFSLAAILGETSNIQNVLDVRQTAYLKTWQC